MTDKLLMPFDDESESFANGFECGMIWEMLNHCTPISRYAHKANEQQIEKMCRRFHADYTIEQCGDEWIFVTASINVSKAN